MVVHISYQSEPYLKILVWRVIQNISLVKQILLSLFVCKLTLFIFSNEYTSNFKFIESRLFCDDYIWILKLTATNEQPVFSIWVYITDQNLLENANWIGW